MRLNHDQRQKGKVLTKIIQTQKTKKLKKSTNITNRSCDLGTYFPVIILQRAHSFGPSNCWPPSDGAIHMQAPHSGDHFSLQGMCHNQKSYVSKKLNHPFKNDFHLDQINLNEKPSKCPRKKPLLSKLLLSIFRFFSYYFISAKHLPSSTYRSASRCSSRFMPTLGG